MSRSRRTAYLPGHRPKFLVIIDETPECDRALYFAARRAARLGGGLVLATIHPPEGYENWFGGSVMRAESDEKARTLLGQAAARAHEIAGMDTDLVVRNGDPAEEITALIAEDPDIAILVLAAGTGSDGPGPLVSTLVGTHSATFAIPIVVIPGALTDLDIDTLA